jgi:chromosome segregation ATPase
VSGLLKHVAREQERVRARIKKAQAQIEREIEENEGIYPFNKGRVSQAELCRKAQIGMATLQGPVHRDTTRIEINGWLARLKTQMIHGHRRVRRTVTDRAEEWKQAFRELQDGWAVAELDFIEQTARIQELESELARMRQEIATAQEELVRLKAAPEKVVRFKGARSAR